MSTLDVVMMIEFNVTGEMHCAEATPEMVNDLKTARRHIQVRLDCQDLQLPPRW